MAFHPTSGCKPKKTSRRSENWKTQKMDAEEKLIQQLKDMFGDIFDRGILQTVSRKCNLDLEQSIDTLLEMDDGNVPKPNSKPHHQPQGNNQKKKTRPKNPTKQSGQVKPDMYNMKPTPVYGGTPLYFNGGIYHNVPQNFQNPRPFMGPPPSLQSYAHQLQGPNINFKDHSTGAIKKVPQKRPPNPHLDEILSKIKSGFKVMVLLRGLPGSGKSYLARTIYNSTVSGSNNRPEYHIYTTDDYFVWLGKGQYLFEPSKLGEAHNWNQNRVFEGMNRGISPIIVDNTNCQDWEMLAYLKEATKFGYFIEILEPITPWAFNDAELAWRNVHNVPWKKIKDMLDRYEKGLTANKLLTRFGLSYLPYNQPPQFREYPRVSPPKTKKKSMCTNRTDKNGDDSDSYSNCDDLDSNTEDCKPIVNEEWLENFNELLKIESNDFVIINPEKITSDIKNESKTESANALIANEIIDKVSVLESCNSLNTSDKTIIRYSRVELLEVLTPESRQHIENNIFLRKGKKQTKRKLKNTPKLEKEESSEETAPETSPDDLIQWETLADNFESWDAFDNSSAVLNQNDQDISVPLPQRSNKIKVCLTSVSPNHASAPDAFELFDNTAQLDEAHVDVLIPEKMHVDTMLIDLVDDKPISDTATDSGPLPIQADNPQATSNIDTLEGELQSLGQINNISTNLSSEKLFDSQEKMDIKQPTNEKKSKLLPSFKGFFKFFKNDVVEPSAPWKPYTATTPVVAKTSDLMRPVYSDMSTNTLSSDFAILTNPELQNNVRILTSTGACIAESIPIRIPRSPPKILMLEKGTMTGEFGSDTETTDSQNYNELLSVFPLIAKDHIRDIFINCEGNVTWAAEILCESKAENSVGDDNDMNASIESEQVVERTNEVDDCACAINFDFAKESKIFFADKKESTPIDENDDKSPKKKTPYKNSQTDASLKLKRQIEEQITIGDDHYSDRCLMIKNLRHGKNNVVISSAESETSLNSLPMDNLDEYSEDGSSDGEVMELYLGMEFVNRLDETFGDGAVKYPGGLNPVVQLPISLARQLHAFWLDSIYQQMCAHEERMEEMMREDTEFARQLQEQENKLAATGQKPLGPGLQEIMDMEIALAIAKSDNEQWLRETTDDLATRLTQQKLKDTFPEIEQDALCDVLQACDNKYDRAVEMLMNNSMEHTISLDDFAKQGQQLVDEAKKTSNAATNLHTTRPIIVVTDPSTSEKLDTSSSGNQLAEFYRAEAQKELRLRDECLEKARTMFQRGQNLVAGYYSEIASVHKHKFENANAKAATAFLSAHSKSQSNTTTLDLHFLYVSEAIEALDMFVDNHLSLIRENTKPHEMLYLITGRGLRSAGGRARVKPAVIKRLKQRKLRYTLINPGLLRVKLHQYDLLTSE